MIFSGTALEVSGQQDPADLPSSEHLVRVRFSVTELFRGPSAETIVVSTPEQIGTCGYSFEAGESYLVHASRTAEGGREVRGRLERLSSDELVLKARGLETFAAPDVRRVRVRARDSLKNGTLIGLGIGGGMGTA